MAAIDFSEFLNRGQQYTFSLSTSNLAYFSGGAFNVQAMDTALMGISSISKAQAWSPAKLSGAVNVSFVYVGDGGDAAGNVAQEIIDRLNGTLTFGSFDLVGMASGAVGVGVTQPPLPSLPGTGAIWGIAVIALLAVFVMSGGAGLVRRVTS